MTLDTLRYNPLPPCSSPPTPLIGETEKYTHTYQCCQYLFQSVLPLIVPIFLQVTYQKSVYKASQTDKTTRTPQAPPLPTHTQSAITAETRSSPTRTPKYLAIPCLHSCMPERRHLRTPSSPPRSPLYPRAFRAATSHQPHVRSPALGSTMGGVVPGRNSHRKPLHSSSTTLCCSQHTTRCRATVRHTAGDKQTVLNRNRNLTSPAGLQPSPFLLLPDLLLK